MSWTNLELVESREVAGEMGVFSCVAIPYSTIVGIYDGQVEIFNICDDGSVDWMGRDPSMSIHLAVEDRRLYALMPLEGRPISGVDFMNHSCEPNCILSNHGLVVRTSRDIEQGEQLTIDYGSMDLIKLGKQCWCSHVPHTRRCII